MAVRYLGFDTTAPPFDEAAVRRAVAMAVDWRGLDALRAAADEPPTSLLPPGTAGRGEGDYLLPHDPEAARAELAAAGYPEGRGFPDVVLGTYGVGATEAIAADLERELGIDVRVERRPFDEHWTMLAEDSPGMWTAGWSADFPHAHDFLGLLLGSGSRVNFGSWSDPDFDALIDAAAATADPFEQRRLYDQAQAIVRDEAPLIPLGYGGSWWLSRDGLRGGHVSGVGIVRFSEMDWRS
jgi:ABC-type transport system substrate-binding protein